jgi:alpha-L-rhamnosidase
LIPVALRCAHLADPLGVTPDRVRLSWMLEGVGTGRAQSAYQVQVTAAGPIDAADEPTWDGGKVETAQSTDIPYAGPPLIRGGTYTWRVRIWDEHATPSAWSAPARFDVELDTASSWHASWITSTRTPGNARPPAEPGPDDRVAVAMNPAVHLRRTFTIDKPVARARLYVTALGLYEARLNGHRVGDAYLTPGWTDYDRRILYQTYDVTALLAAGENVLGALLADGWYAGFVGYDAKRAGAHYGTTPELLAQLVIDFADGGRESIVTDERWQSRTGAILHADLLMGERHDARLEPSGWDRPGFTRTDDWRPVATRDRDARPLRADPGPPIRVTQDIAPVAITRDPDGRHIVDFGQNLTGWLRIHADGPPGTRIRIRHGEVLADDGSLYTANLRTARQTDEFAIGDRPTRFEPRFTMHGFRYAEITGLPDDPDPADIVARVVHSDIAAAGSLTSSEPWLDRLFHAVDWGQRGNFVSVPTDCPQRDERLGWLGDAQVFARTACYNRDVAAFFDKWMDDVADAQLPSGAFPDIAPRLHRTGPGAPAWGDAGVIVPWTVWKMYADRGILHRHFAAMTAWMDFLERANPDHLRTREVGNGYNDWLSPGEDATPPELLATAYWAHDAALMAEIAEAMGRHDDAAGYRSLRSKIRSAFAEAFVSEDGRVASEAQTAYVLALHTGLIPEDLRASAADRLVTAIRTADDHLTTGFVGVGYILPVLSQTGHTDVAYRLLEQRTQPSWRYMIEHGATTVWERWDGWTADAGFQSPWMNSFNHYALGSVAEWLYRFVLGIDQEPGAAGFGRLVLRPHPGGRLRHITGLYRSVRGPIATAWERSEGRFAYRVELPPNTTATVHVPSSSPDDVRDANGNPPTSVGPFPGADGVGEATFAVGSGTHEYAGPLANRMP